MPRVKEYIREEVLEAATQVFWEKGYSATSVSDLVEATGLNKHSMYKEFGNKEGLFLECIENYAHRSNREPAELLEQQPLSFKNIERFFANRVDYLVSQENKGCMMVNNLVEQEVLCDEINRRTRYYMGLTEKAFFNCLEAAQKDGEIPEEKDIGLTAKYLLCFMKGLNVTAKTNPTKKTIAASR